MENVLHAYMFATVLFDKYVYNISSMKYAQNSLAATYTLAELTANATQPMNNTLVTAVV